MAARWRRREPTGVSRSTLDINASVKGPLRAVLRRVQHSADHIRRRSGFLPGTQQEFADHPSWSETSLCVREATVPKIT